MQLTLGFLTYMISPYYRMVSKEADTDPERIITESFRLLSAEEQEKMDHNESSLQDGVLYVSMEHPQDCFVYEKGRGKSIGRRHPVAVMYPDGSFPDLAGLVNRLQECFSRFRAWHERMELHFLSGDSFKAVLEELGTTFGFLAVLVDKNLRYMAVADIAQKNLPWIDYGDMLPPEQTSILMEDENFRTATTHDHAFIYNSPKYKDRFFKEWVPGETAYYYCYNLKINGVYEARLLISQVSQDAIGGGLGMAEYMGSKLTQLLIHHNASKQQESEVRQIYETLADLLHGIPKKPEEIARGLKAAGWNSGDRYCLLYCRFFEKSSISVTRRYNQIILESYFPQSRVLVEEDDLYCVLNVTKACRGQKEESVRAILHKQLDLAVFLRDNLCQAGISREMDGASELKDLLVEARYALETGAGSGGTSWYYYYDDVILQIMCAEMTRNLKARQLYHPAIVTLLEYDRDNETELVKTVYEYIRNQYNVTRTAEVLYVHRTTALFRLDRIKILTGIDWENPRTRLHLAMTFELMGYGRQD